MPTKIEGMAELIRKAKDDPKFFHSLVWDTEKAVGSVDFLSREEKAAIMRVNPEDLVVGLATGHFGAAGLANERMSNCGGSCGVSCGGSCGISCGGSCGTSCATSSLVTDPASQVSIPAVDLARIQNEIAAARFSNFTR